MSFLPPLVLPFFFFAGAVPSASPVIGVSAADVVDAAATIAGVAAAAAARVAGDVIVAAAAAAAAGVAIAACTSKLIRVFKNIQECAMELLGVALKLASVGMAPLRKHPCLTTSSSSRKQSNQALLRPNVCLIRESMQGRLQRKWAHEWKRLLSIRQPFHLDCEELC